ncbi:class I adenylate-forming enzyme family protein [Oceanobacillus profundus]|nr:class I adenylate-forming enzyme family protein [Oceanobacillus profundus]
MDLLKLMKKKAERICIRNNNRSICYQEIYETTKNNQELIRAYTESNKKQGQPVMFTDITLGWKLIPLYLACLAEKVTIIPIDLINSPNQTKKILNSTFGIIVKNAHVDDDGKLTKIDINHKVTGYKELRGVAFVLYTSGTTGSPKGIMLTYDNIINNALQIKQQLQIEQEDRLLIIRPLLYASSITGELMAGLIAGASFVVKKHTESPFHSIKLIKMHQVTMMFLTPSLMFKILQLKNYNLYRSLTKVVLSGERLYKYQYLDISNKLLETIQVFNGYGLTEASPRISMEKMQGTFQEASVGNPLTNLKIKITDKSGKQVSKGVKGYLNVKGPSVMKGYFRQKKLTEQALVDGWLNTHDIAKMVGENLYIYGRADNIFIRNGINIQLEDVEELLRATPYVEDTIVEIVKRENHAFELVAHIVPTKSYDPVLLRKEIRKWDTKFWPDKIKIQQEIPNGSTGKLSRILLKQTK